MAELSDYEKLKQRMARQTGMADTAVTGGKSEGPTAGETGAGHFANQMLFGRGADAVVAQQEAHKAGLPAFGEAEGGGINWAALRPPGAKGGPLLPGGREFEVPKENDYKKEDIQATLKRGEEEHPWAATGGRLAADVVQQAATAPIGAAMMGGKLATLGGSIGSNTISGTIPQLITSAGDVLTGDKDLLQAGKDVGGAIAGSAIGGAIGHGLSRINPLTQESSAIGKLTAGMDKDALQALPRGAQTGLEATAGTGLRPSAGQAAQIGGLLDTNPARGEASRLAGQALEKRMGAVDAAQEVSKMGERQATNLRALAGDQPLRGALDDATQRAAAATAAVKPAREAAEAATSKLRTAAPTESVNPYGVAGPVDTLRKTLQAGETGIGKDSPAAFQQAIDTGRFFGLPESALSQTERTMAKKSPAYAGLQRESGVASDLAQQAERRAGQATADVQAAKEGLKPLSAAESITAKEIPKPPPLPEKKEGSILDTIMKGAGLFSLAGGDAGTGAMMAGGKVALSGVLAGLKSAGRLGEAAALTKYLDNPTEFIKQVGKPAASRFLLNIMATEGAKPAAGMLMSNPALTGFIPGM